MDTSQIKQLGNAVGFVVGMNQPAVVSLLRAHGSAVSTKSSTDTIISEAIEQVLENPKFNKAFDKLTKKTAKSFLQATKTNPNSSADGGFDWGGLAGGLLSSGTSIFGQISATNAQKKLAEQQAKIAKLNSESAIAQANAQLEIERIRLAQINAQNAGGTGNTMLYVGIGLVGVLVIGGLIVVMRKK